jgi:hypothetical protein
VENGNLKLAATRTDAELARLRDERARIKAQEAAAAAGVLAAQHQTSVLAAQVERQTKFTAELQARQGGLCVCMCARARARVRACVRV